MYFEILLDPICLIREGILPNKQHAAQLLIILN